MKSIFLMFSALLLAGTASAQGLTLSSDSAQGQLAMKHVFNGFGCSGENISPELNWQNAPEGTKSFAITMYDKDAPTDGGWWRWLVFNIPSDTTALPENAGKTDAKLAPKGSIQIKTSFGATGYGGACPPEGDRPHQYLFTVYALNTETLDVDENTPPNLVGYLINAETIQKASTVAYYAC
ncbi:MAG: YbhB/YbcL family Raf kinase inhibitor-like protein [Oleiphilaceae bacterium]|nr:YbhB/YbcL family Raf kinase inhibitor-like protein [Oleiphilaceae bacterium]